MENITYSIIATPKERTEAELGLLLLDAQNHELQVLQDEMLKMFHEEHRYDRIDRDREPFCQEHNLFEDMTGIESMYYDHYNRNPDASVIASPQQRVDATSYYDDSDEEEYYGTGYLGSHDYRNEDVQPDEDINENPLWNNEEDDCPLYNQALRIAKDYGHDELPF